MVVLSHFLYAGRKLHIYLWLWYSVDVIPAITKRSLVTPVAINCNWKGISNKYALGKCRLHSVVCGEYFFLTFYDKSLW